MFQVKAIHVYLIVEKVQNAMFYWNAKVTTCKYRKQRTKSENKKKTK